MAHGRDEDAVGGPRSYLPSASNESEYERDEDTVDSSPPQVHGPLALPWHGMGEGDDKDLHAQHDNDSDPDPMRTAGVDASDESLDHELDDHEDSDIYHEPIRSTGIE